MIFLRNIKEKRELDIGVPEKVIEFMNDHEREEYEKIPSDVEGKRILIKDCSKGYRRRKSTLKY